VLLAGTLPDRASLRQIGATVFHSAVLLDQLGVNFYATREGGPRTGDERPFDIEALGDYLATLRPTDYTEHAQTLVRWLSTQEGLQGHTWAMDCLDVRIPKGCVPRGRWPTRPTSRWRCCPSSPPPGRCRGSGASGRPRTAMSVSPNPCGKTPSRYGGRGRVANSSSMRASWMGLG
jgi:hypothetical protein